MLVDVFGTKKFGKLDIKFPPISLDKRFNYKIAVRHLNFLAQDQFDNNELFCLTTNIVDLSNRNTMQSIISFNYDGNTPKQNINPAVLSYRSVQLYELENVSLSIKRYLTDEEIALEYLFLSLEISRSDAYGRF